MCQPTVDQRPASLKCLAGVRLRMLCGSAPAYDFHWNLQRILFSHLSSCHLHVLSLWMFFTPRHAGLLNCASHAMSSSLRGFSSHLFARHLHVFSLWMFFTPRHAGLFNCASHAVSSSLRGFSSHLFARHLHVFSLWMFFTP